MRPGPSWGKKDKHCDPTKPADRQQGSFWDHVLIETQSRLIVTLVVGRRNLSTAYQAFLDFYRRTDGQLPPLITTDEYASYLTVLVSTYGIPKEDLELTEEEKIEFGWEEMAPVLFPVEINYATVQKEREKGRVVKVEQNVVLGTEEQVTKVLESGATAATLNTSYVERYHGTSRHRNARKARKVYTFSKDLAFHRAATWLCVVFSNFGWTPRTLREQVQEEPPRYHYRTPAMVAGLSQKCWSMREILSYPVYPSKEPPTTPVYRYLDPRKMEGR